MGITIQNKSTEYSMGYISFGHFRMKIAEKVDVTLARLFKDFIFNGGGQERLDKIFKYLNKEDGFAENELNITQPFINFLFASDCDGKINQEDCEKILHTLERINDDEEFGYSGKDDEQITINKFKEMLAENEEIEWY